MKRIQAANEALSVRLSSTELSKLEAVGKASGLSKSSIARTFIQSCLFGLSASINRRVLKQQELSGRTNVDEKEGQSDVSSNGQESDSINDSFGFPYRDIKGKLIQIDTWEYAKKHKNYACPCGSGKKFKRCHGQVN